MDEKTEELRDIFVEVTEAETVTEQQAEGRGSLTDADEAEIDARIEAVIERMRERYDFRTDLGDDTLCQVVRGFFDGDDDATIATGLDAAVDAAAVFRARMDLHLLAEADTEFPFDLATLRRERAGDEADTAAASERPLDALAADLDTDAETVERALLVAEAQAAVRRVSQRYQSEFEDAIPDAALAVHLTESVTDDGLEEAAEDIETDTKF